MAKNTKPLRKHKRKFYRAMQRSGTTFHEVPAIPERETMTAKKKPEPRVETVGIKLSVDLPTVLAAREAILAILASDAEQKTKRVALEMFNKLCGINGATISNCHIEMGR